MMKHVKRLFTTVIVLALLMSLSSIGVSAAEESVLSDDVIRILYEKTNNPMMWIDFLEENQEDAMGKWLPLLLMKLASGTQGKEVMDMTYMTVTEGFDWGPAITKLVLYPGVAIDENTLSEDTFEVISVRSYKDFDFSTYSFADPASDHEVARTVTAAYLSDAQGNKTTGGTYITLEMPVGPTMSEGSPFNYNFLNGFNEYVTTSYKISLSDTAELTTMEGTELALIPTDSEEYTGDMKLIADEFNNDQPFSYDGIDLLYADYVPETGSTEAGSNPLIIWLHGAGEGGTDTTISLLGNKVVNLATDTIQQYYGTTGAYILTPQAPTMWMDYDGTHTYNNSVEGSMGDSYYTEALMALIENYVTMHPEIDPNRVYLGGCSNGGYMTVHMITTYPEYFAAAYPVCEAYSVDWITENEVMAIKDMPIWFTHAKSDSVVPVAEGTGGVMDFVPTVGADGQIVLKDDFSTAMYERLIAAGATNVHYSLFEKVEDTTGMYLQEDGVTPYEYMGHWSWIHTLNNECVETIGGVDTSIFEWLAMQSK